MSDGEYCCVPDSGNCCGPGSWCCARAGEHNHDDEKGPRLASLVRMYWAVKKPTAALGYRSTFDRKRGNKKEFVIRFPDGGVSFASGFEEMLNTVEAWYKHQEYVKRETAYLQAEHAAENDPTKGSAE